MNRYSWVSIHDHNPSDGFTAVTSDCTCPHCRYYHGGDPHDPHDECEVEYLVEDKDGEVFGVWIPRPDDESATLRQAEADDLVDDAVEGCHLLFDGTDAEARSAKASATYDVCREFPTTLEGIFLAAFERTCKLWPQCLDWDDADWMLALMGEVGELADLLKKKRRGDAVPYSEIHDEFADILIYLLQLARYLRIDPSRAVAAKFNLVSIRLGSTVRLNPPT
jgi:NTP pyrophosphatase (non-canonical NTP hydrolase)